MALKMTIDNEYEMQNIFSKWDRDYYSLDGYKAILDYFEETDCGCDSELDVVGICCDFTEYDKKDLTHDYGITFADWLEYSGKIADWILDNGFDSAEDMTYDDDTRMEIELYKEEVWDEYFDDEIEKIKNEHYIIELDNGNYLMIG